MANGRQPLHAGAWQLAPEANDDTRAFREGLQQRVFEPVFRVEFSRKRDTRVNALGLTGVRAVVLDRGGHIELRNRSEEAWEWLSRCLPRDNNFANTKLFRG